MVLLVSSGGERFIWLRNDLNNIKQRLKALKAKMAQGRTRSDSKNVRNGTNV